MNRTQIENHLEFHKARLEAAIEARKKIDEEIKRHQEETHRWEGIVWSLDVGITTERVVPNDV